MGLFVKGDKELPVELGRQGRRRQAWMPWVDCGIVGRAALHIPPHCPPQPSPGSPCPGPSSSGGGGGALSKCVSFVRTDKCISM